MNVLIGMGMVFSGIFFLIFCLNIDMGVKDAAKIASLVMLGTMSVAILILGGLFLILEGL